MAKMRLLIMQMHTQRIDLARVTNMAHKQLISQIDEFISAGLENSRR